MWISEDTDGTVAKLTTARTIRTNLASTSTASFDGSANITPGVTGTLPIANGGTGNTEGKAATAVKLAQNRRLLTYLANKYDSTSSDSNYNGHWDLSGNTAIPVFGTLGVANGGTGGTDSDWKTLTNTSVFTGSIYYRKIGMWVEVRAYQIKLAAELTTSSGINLTTLPSGYRPDSGIGPAGGNANTGMGMITIVSGGAIKFYKPATASSYPSTANIYFSCMFFIG